MTLIKPIDITIADLDGIERTYRIGRFPAIIGLEIIAKVPGNIASLSKQLPHLRELVLQMCKYVAVDVPLDDGGTHEVILSTAALVDNHVPDGQTLLHLCFEIMRHNTSFFGHADQSILDYLVGRLADSLPRITRTLTPYWQQFSASISQPSPS